MKLFLFYKKIIFDRSKFGFVDDDRTYDTDIDLVKLHIMQEEL